MRLSELKTGQSASIVSVAGHGGFRRRILEMGFVRGQRVDVLHNAPLQDPIVYRLMDYEVSLRRSEARMVEVEACPAVVENPMDCGSTPCEGCVEPEKHRGRKIRVALVGNPNSGKTSLFNAISGRHEHVGNYGGVTVDARKGSHTYRGYHFEITDLPGTYALTAYTPEERYVRTHLSHHTPDVVLNVVAASNIERNLYLTTELIDLNPPTVVALNMYDELEESGARLDYEQLGRMLGVPMVPVVARSGRGIEQLLDTVIAVWEGTEERVRHIHINQGEVVERAIKTISSALKEHVEQIPPQYPPRYVAGKLLEGDSYIYKELAHAPAREAWIELAEQERARIKPLLREDIETALADRKYGFIAGALKETYQKGAAEQRQTTRLIDAVVTHKLWGFPIFLALMWLMFYCTFTLGAYPQEWIENGVAALGAVIGRSMQEGPLKDLLIDGVIGGVGGVIVFLPNILILYFFIAFMEDSGYLARAAFIMDRVMHRIGLHGKSFIPMIMGFGCNVPAIMATRTIESRSSRLITVLLIPFMSCSARLPVYILFAGAFFAAYASYVMLGLYVLGILLAVLTARLLRRFLFKSDETPFVMELPPYRMPTTRSTLHHMWDRARQYLRKMGGVILLAAIVVWFLSYFPRTDGQTGAPIENSYLGRVGHAVEPAFRPLGLDWKAGVAILTGVSAKEVVVSTFGVLYAHDAEENEEVLGERLKASGDFTPASSLALLVFMLLYLPCLAAIAAIAAEIGWRWAAFAIVYNTALAWLAAWITYLIAS